MKLFEYIKVSQDERKLLLCALPIYHQKRIKFFETKKILCGLLTTTKKNIAPAVIKEIYLCNLPILKRVRNNMHYYYYCGNKLIYTRDLAPAFVKKYRDVLSPEYKNIIILNGHHGEAYSVSAFFAKRLMQKYDNVKFVCYRECHKKMWNLFWPDVEIGMLKGYAGSGCDKYFKYKDQNFYYTFLLGDNDFENLLKGNPIPHRIDSAIKNLGLTRDELLKKELVISEQDKRSFNEKLKNMNLNLDKFVILAPEADSIERCDLAFWEKIAKGLQQRGYSIYLNVLDEKFDLDGCDKTFLTHAEILQLADLSKGTIALRSGFSELISYLNTPMHVIFTSFLPFDKDKDKKVNDILFEANLIAKYPFRNPDITYEYKYYDYEQDELVANILAKF